MVPKAKSGGLGAGPQKSFETTSSETSENTLWQNRMYFFSSLISYLAGEADLSRMCGSQF